MPTDKGHEAADRELKKLEASLKKMYKEAADDMKKKAEEFMRDFERKDNDMKKLVEAGKLTEEKYMTWRRNQMMTEERIQDMKDQLTQDLVHADQIAAAMINETLPQAYAENMNFGTYEIEHGTEINTSFTLYDKKTVENLMKKDPKIIPQARVSIPEDERWNRQKLTSAIAQGILQGESIPKIADRLQNVAAMDRNAAIRNARTYTTAAENKGRVDSIARANDMGIPADQEWIATLDDRTRMEHRHLDGQVRPVGEPFSADGYRIMYPGDPDAEPEMIYNCRCTLVSKVRGRIYNDERNESKLGGMSYEEWKHAKDRQMEPPKEEPKQEEKADTRSTIEKMYEGTDVDPDKAEKAFADWAQGEVYDIREAQQNGDADKGADYIEELIEKSNVHFEGDPIYRGIMVDQETIDRLTANVEAIDYDEEAVHLVDMLGTSSWTTDQETAEHFATEAAKIMEGDMELTGDIPLVFEIPNVQENDILIDIDEFAGLDQSEILMSKDAALDITGIREENGVYYAELDIIGRKDPEETKKEEPATIKTIGNTGMTFNEVYGDRPTVEKQIKGVSKKGDARSEWLQDTLEIDEDDADYYLEAVEQYTKGDYTIVHNGDPKAEDTIEALDEMLHDKSMPVFDGTIYRGVHVDDSDDLTAAEKINAIISGGTWNEPGITSFSSRKDKAEQFAHGAGSGESGMCVLIVCKNNKSGCPIQHLTDQRPEAEVLVPSDIKDRGYKIINSKSIEKIQTIEQWHWDEKIKGRVEDEPRIIKRQWAIIEVEENE